MRDQRGILFPTEWRHNCACVLVAAEEYVPGHNIAHANPKQKVEAILPIQIWDHLNKTKNLGITPTENAERPPYTAAFRRSRDRNAIYT